MDVCLLWCFVLSSRGLCDGPIPLPGESYRVCVCVSECDREAWIMRRPWATGGCCASWGGRNVVYVKRGYFYVFSSHTETIQYFMIFFNKTLFLMLFYIFTFCLNSVHLQELIFFLKFLLIQGVSKRALQLWKLIEIYTEDIHNVLNCQNVAKHTEFYLVDFRGLRSSP